MRGRLAARRALGRGPLRWWLVWGPVRSGTTLMADLIARHARWEVSDWGLALALSPPQSPYPDSYDPVVPRRALLAEVMASCRKNGRGSLDLVYKQANLRQTELDHLISVVGEPERRILCLREPAGFMSSAVKKFPDVPLDNLREINYIQTLAEHDRIGGEVFLYHPGVTGADYAAFLAPLEVPPEVQASVRFTGSEASELTTPGMWEAYERLLGKSANVRPLA